MKRLSIALMLLLALHPAMQARKFFDSILRELPQHVKSITEITYNPDGTTEEETYLFTQDGQEVYDSECMVLKNNYNYTSEGIPTSKETSSLVTTSETIYKYDTAGHLIYEKSNNHSGSYTYSGNDLKSAEMKVYSLLGMISLTKEYEIISRDRFGNWTERKMTISNGYGIPATYRQTRRIEYYPEAESGQNIAPSGTPRFTLTREEIVPSELVKKLLGTFPWGQYSLSYFSDYFKNCGYDFNIQHYGGEYELFKNFYGCGPIKGGKQILPCMRIGLSNKQFVLSIHNLKKGEFKKIRNDILNELKSAGYEPIKGKNDIEGEFWYGQINGIHYRITSLHVVDYALFFRVYNPCFGTSGS